jgi:hypothetical protein
VSESFLSFLRAPKPLDQRQGHCTEAVRASSWEGVRVCQTLTSPTHLSLLLAAACADSTLLCPLPRLVVAAAAATSCTRRCCQPLPSAPWRSAGGCACCGCGCACVRSGGWGGKSCLNPCRALATHRQTHTLAQRTPHPGHARSSASAPCQPELHQRKCCNGRQGAQALLCVCDQGALSAVCMVVVVGGSSSSSQPAA